MTEQTVPETVLAQLTTVVAGLVPDLRARVPPEPAAVLGRLGAGPPGPPPRPAAGRAPGVFASARDSAVAGALRELGVPTAERLLGALELAVAALDVAVPGLPSTPSEPGPKAVALTPMNGAAASGVSTVDQLVPGLADTVARLVALLADRPELAGPLAVEPGDEQAVAAGHGAGHLALAVLVAACVVGPAGLPMAGPPAVIGVGIGAAALSLRSRPMPSVYAEALLARRRAEYRLPLRAHVNALVEDHRFVLAEGGFGPVPDFAGNGLVAALPDGIAVRTGVAGGTVPVMFVVVDGLPEPPDMRFGWDEVVEVGWTAPNGGAAVRSASPNTATAPPWPGEYRARVHARGRDGEEDESYEVVVWRAPRAAETVHARRDRLGHRLRGEPEPPPTVPPDAAHRWFERHWLADAATITVVRGASVAEVLHGFGADPEDRRSLRGLTQDLGIDPWVAVLDVGDAVLAVEANGWQGAQEPVLRRVSTGGVTASMYRNVNALSRLSFARDGTVVTAFEPGMENPGTPEIAELVGDLDLAGFGHRWAKALTAVERFTGYRLTEDDLGRLLGADVGYPILPQLPELHRVPRDDLRGREVLGADTVRLLDLPDDRLRELAWWVAEQAAAHHGLTEDPDVAGALTGRVLDGEAARRARRSELGGHGEHHWMWMAVHEATNPDPLSAVLGALDAIRHTMPDVVRGARGWLPG